MSGVNIKKNVCSLESLVAQIQSGETDKKKDSINANFLLTIFLKTRYVRRSPTIETARANQKRIYGELPKILTKSINIQ